WKNRHLIIAVKAKVAVNRKRPLILFNPIPTRYLILTLNLSQMRVLGKQKALKIKVTRATNLVNKKKGNTICPFLSLRQIPAKTKNAFGYLILAI
ncbi:hypothetical protein LAZ25_09630, partial [Haemophilus influenzae]|uniref:hypothetical protein n=1 Tax=Haemophilus influenzae TaxID=727 RepID=UPI001CC488F8